MRVCVVGAGVIGLSAAVRIQNEIPNTRVTVIAEKFSPNTTSDGSAGFWQPHLLSEGQEHLVSQWGSETLEYLLHLSRSSLAGELGAQLISGYSFFTEPEDHSWRDQVFGYRQLDDKELEKLYPRAKYGIFFTSVMIDVKSYLPWLLQRFKNNGGEVYNRKVNSLKDLFSDYDVVVNCTGIGANTLVNDKEVNPIRGQVMKVKAPWVKHFMLFLDPSDENGDVYVLPGPNTITLGGTAQRGDWSTEIDKADRRRIWQGCLDLIPSLKDAEIVSDWTGLRPHRSSIRLEVQNTQLPGKFIVHNYGHSGAGITLHWGCAGQVVREIKAAMAQKLARL